MTENIEIKNREELLTGPSREERKKALDLFEAGINSVLPNRVIRSHLTLEGDRLVSGGKEIDLRKIDRIVVVGAGKAGYGMATAIEKVLGSRISDGLVIIKDEIGKNDLKRIKVARGSHPVPSRSGVDAAEELLQLARSAGSDDLIITLISGGGSSLLSLPKRGVDFEEFTELTERLLSSGASIGEINVIRKNLSRIKGGRLAREIDPARALGLIMSDVVGDNLSTIASGPTVPEESHPEDALAILEEYEILEGLTTIENSLSHGDSSSTPVRRNEFQNFDVENQIVASNMTALKEMACRGEENGLNTLILSSRLEGESKYVGKTFGQLVRSVFEEEHPLEKPALLLSGGETTVSLGSKLGGGGPNQEFTLAAGLEINGLDDAVIGAIDSDGEDGSTKIAGGLIGGTGNPNREKIFSRLRDHDSSRALRELDGAIITGPTGTNVNDLRLGLLL